MKNDMLHATRKTDQRPQITNRIWPAQCFIQVAVMTDRRQSDPDSHAPHAPHAPDAPTSSFWLALENVPGGTALHTTWSHHLGPDLETFTSLFLRPKPGEAAVFVPCPWKCGCMHKVVPQSNGTLYGLCQCDPAQCGTYTVMPYERVTWELDWSKIGTNLCRAFRLDFKLAKLGLYNSMQVGSWSRDAFPAILTLPASQRELLHTISMLVARLNRPFILFAPTNRCLGLAAKELLSNLGAIFIPLDSHVSLSRITDHASCPQSLSRITDHASRPAREVHQDLITLSTKEDPSALFSQLVPQIPEAPDQDLASRVCVVLDDLDTSTRRKHPSLGTVFKLYFVQQLPVAQVAKKCRCSVGTIINRLKLIQSKTGATPDQLRRVSPYFSELHGSLSDAKSDYFKRHRHNL